ncbi:hypothetical protein TrST_g10630 [Triparma strigata]|uniref:CSC1/OSCA1-like 7TM region domain-containing protein n=1 Tax=Triparma strigata TaxID=1606541 RepID=A0A9W7B481_9STRA|nr:hypothetical protein TrST_g10630 [Triparma strigata]
MADGLSAYGADEEVVTWTIWTNSCCLTASLLAYGAITCSKSFREGRMWSKIYSPRLHLHPMLTTPEPNHHGPIGWIFDTWSVPDMDYMMTSGLDALMMTKFHMTLFKILFSCMIYGVFVLCPVHNQGTDLETSTDENYECKIIDANKDMTITAPFTSGVCCPDNDDSPGICTCSQLYANFSASPDAMPWNGYPPKCTVPSIYTKLTMANIDKNSGGQNPLVWYDVFGAYLFLGVAMYFFTRTWEEYVKYRHFWLSKPCAENQTVVVDHIPLHLRSNHALYTFFSSLFPNQIASCSIVLDVKGLDTLISLRDKTAFQLDYALACFAKSGYKKRPTFVFHNWKSRLNAVKNRFLPAGAQSTNPNHEVLRRNERASRPSQTPLLSAIDTHNSNINVNVAKLSTSSAPPPYGCEVDSIEYYQILLEQYNELVETKQQEFICWHAWHEKQEEEENVWEDGEEGDEEEEESPLNPGIDAGSSGIDEESQQYTKTIKDDGDDESNSNASSQASSLRSLQSAPTATQNSSLTGTLTPSRFNIRSSESQSKYGKRSKHDKYIAKKAQPLYIRQAGMLTNAVGVLATQKSRASSARPSLNRLSTDDSGTTPPQSNLYAKNFKGSPTGKYTTNAPPLRQPSLGDDLSSDGTYSSLYSSLSGKLQSEVDDLTSTVTVEESETNTEMEDIHKSIRGLVDNENGRDCCCCFKLPSGARWQKVPLEVMSQTINGMSKEERRLERLKYLAKSVVDKTIDAVIGNPISSTGFVTFTSITAANIAAQTKLYPAPLQMLTSKACQRSDLIWSNLERTIRRRFIKHLLSIGVSALIILSFSIPTTIISLSLTAAKLKEYWEPLAEFVSNFPLLEQGLGFVAPMIIMILVICMPPIFACLCKFVFKAERTLSAVHQHVFQRYFLLLYFNIFVVLLLSGTILDSINELVEQSPKEALESFGQSFPRISNFYLDYIVIKIGVGLSLEITRLSAFFQAGLKAIFSDDLTAQQREKMVIGCRSITRSGGFYYGRFLAEHCLVFVLIFAYSVIAPLILLPGTVFFCLATVIYKRQLLWCYEPELSSDGTFWPQCFRRCVWGIVSSQVALITQIAVLEEYDKIVFILVLPPITLLWAKYVQRVFEKAAIGLPLSTALAVDDMVNEEIGSVENRADTLRDTYSQPSLISEPEPIYRGDGGYDKHHSRMFGCCCPYSGRNGVGEEEYQVGGKQEGEGLREPFVHLPRRQTRGLSWGRKFQSDV